MYLTDAFVRGGVKMEIQNQSGVVNKDGVEDCSECKFLLLYTLFKYTLYTLIVISLGSKAMEFISWCVVK